MAKSDGAIVTVLPVKQDDVKFAIAKNILDPSKMFHRKKYESCELGEVK